MKRPEYVNEAIADGEHGCPVGNYEAFVLKPAYQPIYQVEDAKSALLCGYEGLVRPFRNGVPVTPKDFFADVDPADRLFVECLCMALHIRGYPSANPGNKKLFINVNVANYQSVDILEREIYFTFSQLSKYGLNSEQTIFEIVETEVVDSSILTRVCEMFRKNGYLFALDDFGSEYSNVERYIKVKPDIVKLDRALFADFTKVPQTARLLGALVAAFRENGAQVLMEGLEYADEVAQAAEMNVDMIQGFHLGKPVCLPNTFQEKVNVDTDANNGLLKLVYG